MRRRCSNLDRGLRDFRINRLHSRCDPAEPLGGQPAPALRHVWAETSKPSPPKGVRIQAASTYGSLG